MYFPDLTPYEYNRMPPKADVLNVGWLSKEHEFPTGGYPGLAVALARYPIVNRYRGSHACEFCSQENGNGEIRVEKDGIVYVAPTLLSHYVTAHGYLPPSEFIDAVIANG